MFAIHSVGGRFDTHAGFHSSVKFLEAAEWGGVRVSSETFEVVRRALPWMSTDKDLRGVVLWQCDVESDWIPNLQGLPTLEILCLHERQVGPELQKLAGLSMLRHFSINSASTGSVTHASPLKTIESLSLWRPKREDLGFAALAGHSNLRIVVFGDSPDAGEFVEQLAPLPALEEIQFQNCGGVTTAQFEQMARLTRLNALIFSGTRVLDDDALEQLSRLPNLKTLLTRKAILSLSERGLDALTRMTALRELSFSTGELTASQVAELRRRMPNCEITAP